MVDNVSIPATGTGTATPVIATDDVSGVHYQIIKLAYGALDTATLVTSSVPLPSLALGDVAHDTADSGNPVKVGSKATAGLSTITLVTNGDRANNVSGLDGVQYVRTVPLEDIVSGNASNTDGTSTQVIATGGSGVKTYLTKVIITNMHATSTIYVEMKSATTTMATIPAPPGGSAISFDPPLPPNAANEAWNFDPSAATTTIYCTAVGFKSKI